MKEKQKQFHQFIVLTLCCIMLFFLFTRTVLAAENLKWYENQAEVTISRTAFDDYYGISFLNRETNAYESQYEKLSDHKIDLLMINGGFLPDAHPVYKDGIMYVALEEIAEPLGITYERKDTGEGLLKISMDEQVLFVQSRNGTEATLNGKAMTMPQEIEFLDKTYIPFRFLIEAFGGSVQYISDFERDYCHQEEPDDEKIRMTVVEMPAMERWDYSIADGLEEITALSLDKHAQIVRLVEEERGQTFGVDTMPDYDPLDIAYAGKNLGRFYVYELSPFKSLPIFFNRYTGEVYSIKPGTPFFIMDSKFPNLNSLY